MLTAIKVVHWRPVNVVADQQVQVSVLVVVEPAGTGRPLPFVGDARRGGHVSEGAVAVVVVKDRPPVAGDVEVRIPIIVVVTHRHALGIQSGGADSSLLGDINKSPIALVAIERGTQWVRRLIPRGLGRLDDLEVQPSVLVVIDPAQAAAQGFQIVLVLAECVVVLEVNAAASRTSVKRTETGGGGFPAGVALIYSHATTDASKANTHPAARNHCFAILEVLELWVICSCLSLAPNPTRRPTSRRTPQPPMGRSNDYAPM